MGSPNVLSLWIHRREMLHQQAMNKDVSTTYAAQEDYTIIQERDKRPGKDVVLSQQETDQRLQQLKR